MGDGEGNRSNRFLAGRKVKSFGRKNSTRIERAQREEREKTFTENVLYKPLGTRGG